MTCQKMTCRRMTSRKITLFQSILLVISVTMIAGLVACSSSSPSTTVMTQPISVGISTALQNLAVNRTASVAATVLNDSANMGVTWTVTCGSTGACGSFNPTSTASGANTTYTAPAAIPTGGTVSIIATSVSDTTKSANITVTITAAAALTVTLTTPPPASLAPLGTANLVVSVANDSANAGVTWSCTPATTCGTFTNVTAPSLTATYTAPATTGNVVITATSVSPPNATASATVTITSAASGTLNSGSIYVFSASGADNNGFYSVAGAFTVGPNGTITGGEQDFIDVDPNTQLARPLSDSISATGSSYATSSDGNLLITLTTCNGTDCTSTDSNVGVLGVETFSATLVSSSQALIVEFDDSATSRGSMDQQTASPVPPSGGYAFYLFGDDAAAGGAITDLGGILNFSSGALSTTSSAFDINDASYSAGAFTDQLFSSGTVSTNLDAFGRVLISLNPATGASTSGTPQINLIGYVVGPEHIRLVETGDAYGSVTGGGALGQTGTFTNSSISGSSYVFSADGADIDVSGNTNALQVAGVLTLTATSGSSTAGTLSGTLNYNDNETQNGQGGTTFTGTYTLDTTNPGRITLSNLNDAAGDFNYSQGYNLQLYLSGTGNAVEISVDFTDWLAGLGFQQTGAGSFTAASFAGNYAFNFGQVTTGGFELDGVGPVAADGVSALTGFVDFNNNIPPTPDVPVTGTFAANASGVFTGTINGISSTSAGPDNFTYYLVDTTRAVAIETDADQLTLGYFELQQ